MKFSSVLFDLDGTLIHTTHLYEEACVQGMKAIGITFTSEDFRHHYPKGYSMHSWIEAKGGDGGDSLGAVSVDYPQTWAWSGGGGGGGWVKLLGLGATFGGTVSVDAGLGGALPPISDPDSYQGLPGADGVIGESMTIPGSLLGDVCN